MSLGTVLIVGFLVGCALAIVGFVVGDKAVELVGLALVVVGGLGQVLIGRPSR